MLNSAVLIAISLSLTVPKAWRIPSSASKFASLVCLIVFSNSSVLTWRSLSITARDSTPVKRSTKFFVVNKFNSSCLVFFAESISFSADAIPCVASATSLA